MAREHLRKATLEGLEAARALLQAAMLTAGGPSTGADSWSDNVLRGLEDLITRLRENASFTLPSAVAEPLAAALDAEIRRWEQRSRTDPDARLVLRAFLGLRELLWELGMRHEPESTGGASAPASRRHGRAKPGRDRVLRFDIED